MLSWIYLSLIALVPILIWFYLLRNHLPQKFNYLVLTFVAGMFSVVPIKLYEKYWDIAVFQLEHLNLFQHLGEVLQIQSLSSLAAYLIAMILVMLGLFLFTAVAMFFFEVCSGDNTVKVFRQKFFKICESPTFFIMLGAGCGLLAFGSSLSVHEKVWFFMIVGMLEEFIKHLVLRFADENKIRSVSEAIQYSIVVALGFAFVENVLYFQSMSGMALLSVGELAMLIGLRSVVSVAAHVGFSAVLGYFYGVAKFSSQIYARERQTRRHLLIDTLHRILHLKGSVLFHEQKMMEGALLAMVLHGVFNALLDFGFVGIALPYVFVLFLVVLLILNQQELEARSGQFFARAG